MPYILSFKAILAIILIIAFIVCIIFFFAFFAVISLPFILLIYLFRKKILNTFVVKGYSSTFYKQSEDNDMENVDKNNMDYIEIEYEKKKEKDIKN